MHSRPCGELPFGDSQPAVPLQIWHAVHPIPRERQIAWVRNLLLPGGAAGRLTLRGDSTGPLSWCFCVARVPILPFHILRGYFLLFWFKNALNEPKPLQMQCGNGTGLWRQCTHVHVTVTCTERDEYNIVESYVFWLWKIRSMPLVILQFWVVSLLFV